MMKFAIGSTSDRKISSACKILQQVTKAKDFEVEGYNAKSLVPDTPWDRQTFDGASNRAKDAFAHIRCDYAVGLESGLIERYGQIFEEAWCCIVTADRYWYGYSSGLAVPLSILERMKPSYEHSDIMTVIEEEYGLPNDTWSTYSGEVILREVSLEEALRNALIQVFAPDNSFYKSS